MESFPRRIVAERSQQERQPEKVPQGEVLGFDDIASVETVKGSVYRYLPDGTTQRYKKVEGKEYDAQSALVYVPDYTWFKAHAPKHLLDRLGDNEAIYTERLLEYVQNPRKDGKKVYIVDGTGRKIETNKEIKETKGTIYLAFLSGDATEFTIPVSHVPKIGFMTFDTRTYADANTGERMRERHLGNRVAKIVRKSE